MKKAIIIPTIAAFAVVAFNAQAFGWGGDGHKRGAHGMKFFHKLDVNDDQQLSKAEVNEFVDYVIKRMDDDEDGKISQDERHRRSNRALSLLGYETDVDIDVSELRQKIGNEFTQADSDNNAQVSENEWQLALQQKRFDRLDANGDGSVSFEEYKQHAEAMTHKRKKYRH